MALNILGTGYIDTIGFSVGSGNGTSCPPFPPCPPPFPPPAPKPSAVDDNVPYNPATYADLQDIYVELSGRIDELSGRGPGSVIVDSILTLTSVNPVQNKVITENLFAMSSDIDVLSGWANGHSHQISVLSAGGSDFCERIEVLSGIASAHSSLISSVSGIAGVNADNIATLSSDVAESIKSIRALSGWCYDEFIVDEFTNFMDVPFSKEIRGGYSDDRILLIGTKGDGLHYMLPGSVEISRCICEDGQDEFDSYQFRNIISGNGCYVATNRKRYERTNIYFSEDGINWKRKTHTLMHNDENGNICYSPLTEMYYHACDASEYPETSSTGWCVEASEDLENWSILTLSGGDQLISNSIQYKSVTCAGNYLYAISVGGNGTAMSKSGYTVVDLTTNSIHKTGSDIFRGKGTDAGWVRWTDGNTVYFGFIENGIDYSDKIVATNDGFTTFKEFFINPDNKLGLEFKSGTKWLAMRSLTKYHGIFFLGTYETASPHIFMSYDMNNWHVISTPPYGIGADMLSPFQNVLYVGYSGDLADPGYLASVRYTYHTDNLVIHGVLRDLEGVLSGVR